MGLEELYQFLGEHHPEKHLFGHHQFIFGEIVERNHIFWGEPS